MSMLILWLFLWIVGYIVYRINAGNESMRWCSLIAFTGGCGGLSAVLDESIRPFLIRSGFPESEPALLAMVGLTSSVGHFITPYVILVFSLLYADKVAQPYKTAVKLVLLIPTVTMYALYPVYPRLRPDFAVLTPWVTLYLVTGMILLVLTYLSTADRIVKRQRLFACLVIIPPVAQALITNFYFRLMQVEDAWRYNTIPIVLQFAAFMYIGARHGILGVRLKFEQDRLSFTMRAVTSGTAILNHSIKNELIKISMCKENIQALVEDKDHDLIRSLEIMSSSIDHLTHMVGRIHEQTQEIVVVKQPIDLILLTESAVQSTAPLVRGISLNTQVEIDPHYRAKGDPVHIREVMNNLIRNAIEAIPNPGEGTIAITIRQQRRWFLWTILDNGSGMGEDAVKHAFDPFFSTKKSGTNFGLGLTYCYNVIRKCGGELTFDSKLGQGTMVQMKLPFS